jgi:hypothetical protein
MRALLDNWSLVLLGAWNTAIFTPEWISQHLRVAKSEQRIEFPMGNPMMPIRYTFEGVRMVVVDHQLVMGPASAGDDVLVRIEMHAKTILGTLRHTPLRAVGINFEFDESDPPAAVANLLQSSDKSRLAGHDFVVRATELKRQLEHSKHGIVNLTFKRNSDTPAVGVHVNFHKVVENSTAAAEHLENRVLSCRDFAMSTLRDVYELEPEEEQHG